ncbi:MAG: nitroreductase family protein [Halobacteriales archaeon]
METTEAIETRCSVHDYTDEEVTRDEIRDIIDDARWSPSSYNLQPWEFVVVDDDEGQEALRDAAYGQEHVTDASAVVVVFGNLDRGAYAEEVFRDQAEKGYTSEERADELVEQMEDEPPDGNEEWAVGSSTIAATTFMHAAWDRGIATCPMGGWDGEAVSEAVDAPETWYPVLMMTVGYPDKESEEWNRERKMRRSTDDILTFGEVGGGE